MKAKKGGVFRDELVSKQRPISFEGNATREEEFSEIYSDTVSSTVETENETPLVRQEAEAECPRDVLSKILRDGTQKMLQAAIQKEVDDYLLAKSGLVDEASRQLVVRNGSLPEGYVITGLGPLSAHQPRSSVVILT